MLKESNVYSWMMFASSKPSWIRARYADVIVIVVVVMRVQTYLVREIG